MKKFILSGIAVVVVAVAAMFNLSNSSNSLLSDLALANIEALASNDIKYDVPHKNNNPTTCYLYIATDGSVYFDEEKLKKTFGAKAKYETKSGIENVCEAVLEGNIAYGCDPYNCHQRVQ